MGYVALTEDRHRCLCVSVLMPFDLSCFRVMWIACESGCLSDTVFNVFAMYGRGICSETLQERC